MRAEALRSLVVVGLLIGSIVAMPSAAEAECQAFWQYDVDEFGDGSCRTVGQGNLDFLGGTGVADCTLSASGNINCRCKGTLLDAIPIGPGAIVGNETDKCCVTGIIEYSLLGIAPRGIATPSRQVNATCRIRKTSG